MEFAVPVSGALRLGPIYVPRENLVVLAICLTAIAALWLLLYRTDLGRGLRALADDRACRHGARPASQTAVPTLAFAIATGLAGLTGALVTPILSLSPGVGDPVLATSFLTVILGGLGSLEGAALAAFVVGIVEAFSSVYFGGSIGALVLFVLVLLLLVFRPTRPARPHRPRRLTMRHKLLGWTELVALLLLGFAVGFIVPMLTRSVLIYSILNQICIGVVAAESVWIMLRMNLLSFAAPAFMAIGGYTVAIAGEYNITNAFLMTAAAFIPCPPW